MELNSKYPIRQSRKIDILLIIIFVIACVSLTSGILHFSQAISSNTSEIIESKEEVPTDIISQIFNSQITTMMLSTFIIAVVGVIINKFRNFKKRFDMVEVVVKAQARMKQQADERERKLEERLLSFENRYGAKIDDVHERIDETNEKVNSVKDEATKALIDFLSRKKD